MSLFGNLFRKNAGKETSFENTLNEKRANLIAPVTEYGRNFSEKKFSLIIKANVILQKIHACLSHTYLLTTITKSILFWVDQEGSS